MANSWNESGTSWGIGNWGQQSNTTITLSGIGLSSSLGEVSAYNHSGWGRLTWGEYSWGTDVENVTFSVTGIGLTSSMGDETATGTIEKGWGRGSWGNRVWGGAYSVYQLEFQQQLPLETLPLKRMPYMN